MRDNLKLFVGGVVVGPKIEFLTQANFVHENFSSRKNCNSSYAVYKDIHLKKKKQHKLSLELDVKLMPPLMLQQFLKKIHHI
jgi:hypothetical protein